MGGRKERVKCQDSGEWEKECWCGKMVEETANISNPANNLYLPDQAKSHSGIQIF